MRLYVRKELAHSLAEHLSTPVNKLNKVNVKKYLGPHKTPSRAACLRPLM